MIVQPFLDFQLFMNKNIIRFFLCIIAYAAFAYTDQAHAQNISANETNVPNSIMDVLESNKAGEGKVVLFIPAAIKSRIGVVSNRNGQLLSGEGTGSTSMGYRIQIYSSNRKTAKTEAYTRASKINSTFPNIPCYVTYRAPFWKLMVGDYESREDANHATRELKRALPGYAREIYVVRHKIKKNN